MNRYQLSGLNYGQLKELLREVSAAIKAKESEINPESAENFRKRKFQQRWRKRKAAAEKRRISRPTTPSEIIASQHNSSFVLSPPGIGKIPASNLSEYFPALILQDWWGITDVSGDYYVYAHVDARKDVFKSLPECGGNWKGTPFYIGKGIGRRAYDLKRNQGHGKRIAELIDLGMGPDDIVHIAFSGLSERKALEIEAKCIYFFGSIYEPGKRGKRGRLLNLDIPKLPEFSGVMVNYRTGQQSSPGED